MWSGISGHAQNESASSQDWVDVKSCFLHVVRHPYKFEIYSIISNGCGQACPKWFKTMSQLYLKNELRCKVDFLHMIWPDIRKYICIWFSLFIWVWSDGSDGHGHVKSNSQYWIRNVTRLNWAVMLIFWIWVDNHRTSKLIWLFQVFSQSGS